MKTDEMAYKGLSKSYDTFWAFLAKIEIKLIVFIK